MHQVPAIAPVTHAVAVRVGHERGEALLGLARTRGLQHHGKCLMRGESVKVIGCARFICDLVARDGKLLYGSDAVALILHVAHGHYNQMPTPPCWSGQVMSARFMAIRSSRNAR